MSWFERRTRTADDQVFYWRSFEPDPNGRTVYEVGYIDKPCEDQRFSMGRFPKKTPWRVFTGWGTPDGTGLSEGQSKWFRTYAEAKAYADRLAPS